MLTLNIFTIRWRIVQTWELWRKKKRTFLFFDLVLDCLINLVIDHLIDAIYCHQLVAPEVIFVNWPEFFSHLIATMNFLTPRLLLCKLILFHGCYDKHIPSLCSYENNNFCLLDRKYFSVMENKSLWIAVMERGDILYSEEIISFIQQMCQHTLWKLSYILHQYF